MSSHYTPVRQALLAASISCVFSQVVLADAISPGIKRSPQTYSEEKPNSSFYGTGVAGRMTESSELRFQGEQDTEDGKLDEAIHKLAKAIQLDPGDPTGHLLYARAMSRKIKAGKGKITPDLVQNAITEWKLLWHHDADYLEQFEAHLETRRLTKIARVLDKQLKREEKQKKRQQELVAQKSPQQKAQ